LTHCTTIWEEETKDEYLYPRQQYYIVEIEEEEKKRKHQFETLKTRVCIEEKEKEKLSKL